jgi:hypothetical protein
LLRRTMNSSGRYREVNPGGLSHSEIHGSAWNHQLSAIRLTALRLIVNVLVDLPARTDLTRTKGHDQM